VAKYGRDSYGGGCSGGGGGMFSEIISVFIISPTIAARFRDIGATSVGSRCHAAACSIKLGNDRRY